MHRELRRKGNVHIILVSNRLATARTVTITPRRVLCACAVILALIVLGAFAVSWFGLRFNLPMAAHVAAAVHEEQQKKHEDFVRDNIASMAVKLGEMQAHILRLDAMGERVSKLSGIPAAKTEVVKKGVGGQGGPLVNPSAPLSPEGLQREIDRLGTSVELQVETLTALESQLMEKRIKTVLLPTMMPIRDAYIGSTFGRRIDPIVGVGALHEGIDFVADIGTPVFASAGGVVKVAEFHPQFGRLIEIDHGNDFTSRYAHLNKISVKPGQFVRRGQEIAASGNSGRSTGPHLHFEVLFKGTAQNPARFLQMGGQLAEMATSPRQRR